MNWLRLYTEVIHDRKLRRLPPAQRWLWIALLCIARQSPQPGYLLLGEGVPVTADDLVDTAAVSREEVDAGIQAFLEQRMLHLEGDVMVITHWDERQFDSDLSSDRVRRHRERRRQETSGVDVASAIGNADGTLPKRSMKRVRNVSETPPDTDTDTESKRESARQRNAVVTPLRREAAHAAPSHGENPLWDVLVEVFHQPKGRVECSRFGKVVKDLKSVDATPDEVRLHVRNHHLSQSHWTLTPESLFSHWGEFERVPVPSQPRAVANGSYQPSVTLERMPTL